MAKPEAAIYIATAQALQTAPANILFIDDREDNIAGAQAAGLQAIHYSYNDHPAFERAKLPLIMVAIFCDGDDQREGVSAFLEKRKPAWRGA